MSRLDRVIAERVRSRTRAQQLIKAGRVSVNGEVLRKPSYRIDAGDDVVVDDEKWVSRAAYKLLGALDGLSESDIELPKLGRVLDAGASTGGFTQVLLEAGAERVYSVDVGHDQLDESLRSDTRVEVREGLNLRDLTLADLDDKPVDLIVGDVSFISLRLLLEPLSGVLASDGMAILLVKPQFEVGKDRLERGGVVKSESLRKLAVKQVIEAAREIGWRPVWSADSQLPGPSGNREIFVCFVGC